MSTGNVVLSLVAAALGGMLWMVADATRGTSRRSGATSAASASALSSAHASGKPVLVEFYADWCRACKLVAPTVEELAVEVKGRARVVRVNVGQNRALAQQHRISGLPTFIAFNRGKETSRIEGAPDKNSLRRLIGL